jgi:hypothetical protein
VLGDDRNGMQAVALLPQQAKRENAGLSFHGIF